MWKIHKIVLMSLKLQFWSHYTLCMTPVSSIYLCTWIPSSGAKCSWCWDALQEFFPWLNWTAAELFLQDQEKAFWFYLKLSVWGQLTIFFTKELINFNMKMPFWNDIVLGKFEVEMFRSIWSLPKNSFPFFWSKFFASGTPRETVLGSLICCCLLNVVSCKKITQL